jgi:predicted regulator of Ras-like GTPase activity (Roadblock/LC7/MglB family)
MEQKKKLTNAQLQKRLENAIVFVPKTKDTISIFFSDKGVRLVADNDGCVIETNYHRHVYSNITSAGVSRPYLYTKRVIEIASDKNTLEEITVKDKDDNFVGYSYQRLLDVLKEKEDKSEYNIVVYYEWFLFNIFQPLYGIGETEIESFLVYEDYLHNIARNAILLSEKTKDMTNKQFIQTILESIKHFTEDLEERVLFPKKTDEQVMKEEIEAIQEQEQNDAMEAQMDAN